MSYENLVPTIESEYILKERDKYLVFGRNCTRKYEGDVKKAGDQVTIYVEGNPTVYVLEKDGSYSANGTDYNGTTMNGVSAGSGKDIAQNGIPNAETIPFAEILLRVNKIALFNVEVGDIDQQLASKKNLMGGYRRAIGKQIALVQDKAIASTIFNYTDCAVPTTLFTPGTTKLVAGTASSNELNILDCIDNVVQIFNERNVGDDVKIAAEVSPQFWRVLKQALRTVDTDNSALLRGRKCTEYNGIYFVKSNNTKVKSAADSNAVKEFACFRTLDAVAFFDPFMSIEAYRPEKGFKDCLKGFELFDCGIVKPNEILWIKNPFKVS